MKFLEALWNNEWTPYNLLDRVTSSKWHKYDNPNISFFGTDYGYSYDITERTTFGKFVDYLPGIVSFLFLAVYYPVMSCLYLVLFPSIEIIHFVFDLVTKNGKIFKKCLV